MLVKNTKIFYVDTYGNIKPKFDRRPTVFVRPINKDVDIISVQFTERWLFSGSGCDGYLEEILCFTDSHGAKSKNMFEIVFQLTTPCYLHGSNDKDGWHGAIIRKSAEDKNKGCYWKDVEIAKLSPTKRFDKKPFKYSPQ